MRSFKILFIFFAFLFFFGVLGIGRAYAASQWCYTGFSGQQCFATYEQCMQGGVNRVCKEKVIPGPVSCSDYPTGKCGVQSRCVGGYVDSSATGCSGGDVCCTQGLSAAPQTTCSDAGGVCDVSSNCSGGTKTGTCTVAGTVCCVAIKTSCTSKGTSAICAPSGECSGGAGVQADDCSPGNVCCVNGRTKTASPATSTPLADVKAVHGSSGLVPCGTASDPTLSGGPAEDCTFNYFITLIQGVMSFLLFTIAMPLAAISFAYAGWLYMSAGAMGKEGNIGEAHRIFVQVVVGLTIALAAYLIVNTIVTGLGVGSQFNFLGGS